MGSGRWGWHDKKTVAEDCRSIDVNRLCRELEPGRFYVWEWKDGSGARVASFGIEMQGGAVRLFYTMTRTGEKIDYLAPITWTPCHYGGRRPWFCCPSCGRRAAKLYLRWNHFLCRICNGLSYESQRENLMERLFRRSDKRKVRLGRETGLIHPLPDRPKGLHRMTWWRLALKDRDDTMKICALLDKEFHLSMDWITKHTEEDSP